MRYLLILLFFFLSGCAVTNISSFKDPEFSGTVYRKIIVVAHFSQLDRKGYIESQFQNLLSAQTDAIIMRHIDVFPPTRKYEPEEVVEKLRKHNIDGMVVVALTDYWTSKRYVPRTTSTYGSGNVYNNSYYYSQNTYSSGGYYSSSPNARFKIKLIDAKSGKTAWVASAQTKGDQFATFKILINSLSRKTVEGLIANNLVLRKKK